MSRSIFSSRNLTTVASLAVVLALAVGVFIFTRQRKLVPVTSLPAEPAAVSNTIAFRAAEQAAARSKAPGSASELRSGVNLDMAAAAPNDKRAIAPPVNQPAYSGAVMEPPRGTIITRDIGSNHVWLVYGPAGWQIQSMDAPVSQSAPSSALMAPPQGASITRDIGSNHVWLVYGPMGWQILPMDAPLPQGVGVDSGKADTKPSQGPSGWKVQPR